MPCLAPVTRDTNRVSAARSLSQARVNDLWIAATALALQVPVITQDDGFLRLEKVGGPKVIRV